MKDVGKHGPGQYVVHDGTASKIGKVKRVLTKTGDVDPVDQSQVHLTDLNYLLENARKQGLLNHAIAYTDKYDDIPAVDYQEALNIVVQAEQMFEHLPSSARNRFKGDPRQFLTFVQDPNNAAELQKMGLLKGNDGITATGAPSGAPTKTDMNGNGTPDKLETPAATPARS